MAKKSGYSKIGVIRAKFFRGVVLVSKAFDKFLGEYRLEQVPNETERSNPENSLQKTYWAS